MENRSRDNYLPGGCASELNNNLFIKVCNEGQQQQQAANQPTKHDRIPDMNFQQNRLIFFQFFQPRYVGR